MEVCEKAIIKTLCYSSVFEYPLTQGELWRFLIWEEKLKKPKLSRFFKILNLLVAQKKIISIGEYYLLKGNRSWVKNRKKEFKLAKGNLKIARRIAATLSLIPTVELIGLTGKLSIGIAKKTDDIDLLIITKPKTLWITRFCVLSFLSILGVKRNPFDEKVSKKICVNMLIDRDHLTLPEKERDLYSAHELVQMKLLFDRNNCYSDFINQNNWTRNFLPNAGISKVINKPRQRQKTKWILDMFDFLEKGAEKLQLWYMKKRRTTEIIKKGYVRFHPKDAREWILPEYNKLIKTINQ